MNRILKWACLGGLFAACGCTSHLVFLEEDHVGLKAAFEPNNPSPVELSIAYRRGVVAVVPQQSPGKDKTPQRSGPSVTVEADGTNKSVTVRQDPNELMSLYSRFRANVGLGDRTRIQHMFVTGTAASTLVANDESLRQVTQIFQPELNAPVVVDPTPETAPKDN